MVHDDSNVPHDNFPESWETFERSGETYGRTDDGKEFKLSAGSTEPQDGRCNAPLRDYERRYGEIRYCGQMPESTFVDEGSDYCKLHKSMDKLMERADELFEHGYFATNYINFAQKIEPEKFLFAVEMFDGLLEQSNIDFEIEYVLRSINTSGADYIQDDEVEVPFPFPQNPLNEFQAQELWYAALSSIMQQNMKETIFEDGVSQETIAASSDMDGKITDVKKEKEEHHLHLPVSRVTKDIKEHLKNGGVEIAGDDDGGVLTFQKNNYTVDLEDDEGEEVEEIGQDEFTSEIEIE